MTMTRHPADLLSLTFGLLFAAIGILLLTGSIDSLSLGWIAPAVAIGLGALLIAAGRAARTATDPAAEQD
jgi:hypothetical protein